VLSVVVELANGALSSLFVACKGRLTFQAYPFPGNFHFTLEKLPSEGRPCSEGGTGQKGEREMIATSTRRLGRCGPFASASRPSSTALRAHGRDAGREAGRDDRPVFRQTRDVSPGRGASNPPGRRAALAILGAAAAMGAPTSSARAEEETIPEWTLDALEGRGEGWQRAPVGDVLFRVLREGKGDEAAGIFDPPESFKTFPFVSVTFACYDESGRMIHQTPKAEYAYQVGIRQALEDERGGVNQMVVGGRRQFAFGPDTIAENVGGGKLFGKKIGPQQSVLVDVTLLKLRPY